MQTARSNRSGSRSNRSSNRAEPSEVEMELAELHRRYRIMESDRKSYSEDSQYVIRKQRQTIEKLKHDNEYLKEELALFEKKRNEYRSAATSETLAALHESAADYQEKINAETARNRDLDKELKLMQSRIFEQRQNMGGVNAAKESNAQISKQVRVLENRLDKSLVKFNESLAVNKGLRDSIDTLRRERVIFDGIYKKLEKQLMERKREMANIIEISNSAYEARDEAQSKMIQLKERADKELAQFETELKELSRVIEQDRKMRDFMRLKEKERDNSARESGNKDEKKRRKKGGYDASRDKASLQLSIEKVQSYEEAFAKIQAATGITDIDEFVTTFIKVEDENFSLFNYVNELNNEIEKIEEQISEIKMEIEKYKGQGANTDNQRKKILKDLEERLTKTEAKAEQYELKFNSALRVVAALKQGIQSLFTRIGCQSEGMGEMLGSGGVTEHNMMQYLGMIEQRTNEILQLVALQQQRPGVPDNNTFLIPSANVAALSGPQAPPGANAFTILPPSTGDAYGDSDDDSEDEEDERPLTRDELKSKTLRGMAKRDSKQRSQKSKKKDTKKR